MVAAGGRRNDGGGPFLPCHQLHFLADVVLFQDICGVDSSVDTRNARASADVGIFSQYTDERGTFYDFVCRRGENDGKHRGARARKGKEGEAAGGRRTGRGGKLSGARAVRRPKFCL